MRTSPFTKTEIESREKSSYTVSQNWFLANEKRTPTERLMPP